MTGVANPDFDPAAKAGSGTLRLPPALALYSDRSEVEGGFSWERRKAGADPDRMRMLALQQSRTATWDWDMATDAFRCNGEIGGLYGQRRQHPPRSAATWLLRIHRDDRERVAAALASCREGRSGALCVEYRLNLDDTHTRWLLSRGGLQNHLRPDSRRMIGVTVDVTALRAAPAEIEPMGEARRRQTFAAIGHISGGVAHDLNNLLGIISNLAELQQRELLPSRIAEFSRRIVATVERGALLTKKLSSLARPGTRCRVELADGLGNIADLVRLSAGDRVAVHIGVDADAWPVHVDASELQLAIVNLAINSGHAMPNGGMFAVTTANTVLSEERSAALHLEAGEYVEIQVTDTGTGMSAETLVRAFEPYFTTKAAGQGSGLGLAQVFAFAMSSGGAVEATSALGAGTSIRLYLPRVVDPGGADA